MRPPPPPPPPPPLLLLLAALLGGAFALTREDFCSTCQDHTMCRFSGVSARCTQGRLVRGVAPADQQFIVDLTNRLRNRVALGQEWRGSPGPQPSAANMLRVTWDVELAATAQRWSDQCNYSHDKCRNLPDTYVGQNIYQRSQYPVSAMSDSGNWSEPIFAWYDEVALMAASQVSSFQYREDIGHYTQTVWASTNRIGCGYTFYQDGDWGKKYYVCNYAPGGNSMGQPLYQVGSPRSACPPSSGDTGTPDPAYPGLCGRAPSAAAPSTPNQAATPAGANPAGPNRGGTIPAGANPAGTIPAGANPAGTIPAGAVTTGTIPAGATSTGTIPAGAMSTSTIPAGTIPVGATPVAATPGSTFTSTIPTNDNFGDNTVGGQPLFFPNTNTFSPDYF